MTTYHLQLINKDPTLNLRDKRSEIKKVFQIIDKGGFTGRSFTCLGRCRIIQINQHKITIRVTESSNRWHPFVGLFLANKFAMRGYCDPKNKSHMFKWKS